MYIKESIHNLSLYNKDLVWDDSVILNRDPNTLQYSSEYLKSVSGNVTVSGVNVNGSIEIFIGVDRISDIVNQVPDFVFSIQNSNIVGSSSFDSITTNFNSNRKIVIRTIPGMDHVYTRGVVTVSLQYTYDFVASLPVDGYEQKEVDRVSGIGLPLMKFYPD